MQTDTPQEHQINIKMLGGFRLSAGDHSIQDSSMRAHQLWHLIEYLITFRKRDISPEELVAALWPKGDIDNPANALKNLVYRIRTILATHGLPYAKEMIVYQRGGYQWNNSLPVSVDVEEFERHYKAALDPSLTDSQRIDAYLGAIDLYNGDFLPSSSSEDWVIPISSYYHLIFFKCVYATLELMETQGRFDEIEAICTRALMIDQFEESIHRHYIMALVKQSKQQQAVSHYSFVTNLFFRELGVSPSSEMRALYREVVRSVHDVIIDLSVIQEDLREDGEPEGAFYCEYEIFKNLYRLEARTAARTGKSIFITLLTVESNIHGKPLELRQQRKAMDNLSGIILSSLRKGDVYARFSPAQYVLMLPSLTYENCEMVMGRIIKRYRQAYRPKETSIRVMIHPLAPIDVA